MSNKTGDKIRDSVASRASLNDSVNRDTERINATGGDSGAKDAPDEKMRLLKRDEDGSGSVFMRRDGLKFIHFFAYSIGHVYNDL